MVRHIINLLNTNSIPTVEETIAIREALAEPNRKILSLGDEITGLRATLDQLLEKRDELNSHIDAHKALLSPVRHLPLDILQEIFNHCLPAGRNPVMSSKEAPVVLTQVCSQWREISISTPRLWAAIHIVIPAGNPFNINRVCSNDLRREAVATWLSRSGTCPLSISLFSSCYITPERANETYQSFIDTLLPFTQRWRSLRLSLPTFHWEGLFSGIGLHDVPLLEGICLEGIAGDWEPDSSCFNAAVKSGLFQAPRLHSLCLPRFHLSILQLPIKWSNLTRFDLSDNSWSLSDKMRLLLRCPQLEYINIRLPSRQSLNHSEQPSVSLPNLLGLSVVDSYRLDAMTLLRHLSTPKLRHFRYERIAARSRLSAISQSVWEDFHLGLASFFGKVLHPIEELSLCARSMSTDDVMGFLSLLPDLKRLSIQAYYPYSGSSAWESYDLFALGSKQLQKLTPSLEGDCGGGDNEGVGGDGTSDFEEESIVQESRKPTVAPLEGPFCPKLEMFHCRGASFSYSAMLRFLRSRSVANPALGISRLREAYIQFRSGRNKSSRVEKKLVKLEKAGMLVTVANIPSDSIITFDYSYSPYQGLPLDEWSSGFGGQRYFGF